MSERRSMTVGWMMIALLLAIGVSTQGCASSEEVSDAGTTLNVMSFNIRYNNPDDGEDAWPNRKDRVASVVHFHRADVVGMQEALIGQIRDLEERLPNFAWVGEGRGEGEEDGEFSPIFYRTDRLEALDHGTFWLSETPDEPGSVGWDAALPRIVTWARFRDRQTDDTFVHFNTHFDHRGEQARRESARLLVQQVDAIAEDAPVVVTGDFNFTPDTEGYATLNQSLEDAYTTVEAPHGPSGTFSTFEVGSEEGRRIDYIFTRNGVDVRRYGALTDQWRGRYPSDHLPVLAEVVIE